jgi:hypothetical protein
MGQVMGKYEARITKDEGKDQCGVRNSRRGGPAPCGVRNVGRSGNKDRRPKYERLPIDFSEKPVTIAVELGSLL